jgi:hypothetical protein
MVDDLYRGLAFPGGVSNVLYPYLLAAAIRPAFDVAGGTGQGIARNTDHPDIATECAANTAAHRRTIPADPTLNAPIFDTDNSWYRARSMVTYAPLIAVATHIAGAFQNEQFGPRFPHLWEQIPSGVPKRLLMTNGNQTTDRDPEEVWKDRKAWMDHWVRGVRDPFVDPARTPVSVRTLLEVHQNGKGQLVSNGIKDSTAFPLEDTVWTPYFLGPGNRLSRLPQRSGTAAYVSGSKRQSWSYQAGGAAGAPLTTSQEPDELDFTSPSFHAPTLIDGPITANLNLATTATDTEVFVQVADRAPDGAVSILQRGMLRASHRAINVALSDFDRATPDPMDSSRPFLYRPWRPHSNEQAIVPGEVTEYLVEVFPVAHVFRPGHRLQLKVTAPPLVDGFYAYAPKALPVSLNTIHFGGVNSSRVTLPVVSLAGVRLGRALGCGEIWQVRCVRD